MYKVRIVECKECGHVWVALSPFETKTEKLQCPKCFSQNAKVYEEKHQNKILN